MQREELEALWAETCDLSALDPSLTLSRLPATEHERRTEVVVRVAPTPGSLVRSSLERHTAVTVDLSARTVHGLANAGVETIDPDAPGGVAAVAFGPTRKVVADADGADVGGETMAAPTALRVALAVTGAEIVPNTAAGAVRVAVPGAAAPAADVAVHADVSVEASAEAAGAAVGDDTLWADPVGGETMAAPSSSAPTTAGGDGGATAGQDAVATLRTPGHGVHRDAGGGAVFELIEPIGEGGMGVVWRARQGSLDRQVAVKAIRAEVDNATTRAQFIAEAVVTGSLDHPNVVTVHELGQSADGGVFLAMKLVDGSAWNDLLHPRTEAQREAAEGFDLRRHLEVLTHVANAVAFAHSRGVVHRDLKPANVMVGAFGEVVLMDWGIAVDVRMPRPEDVRGTHKLDVSGPAGTPAYMAPELATGRGADISVATDVYLLGAILNEIATGHAPHQGRSLGAVLLAAARSEPPVWPDDAPRALHEICCRAMAYDPADRYPSAEAFVAALREYREHADSLRLSDEAEVLVERLRNHDRVDRKERYGLWARAQARFVQALELWPGNEDAIAGKALVALAIAEEALGRGDLGLAEAQAEDLRPLVADGDQRAVSVDAAIARGRSRGRNARILTAVVVVALALVAAFGARVARHNAAEAAAERASAARATTLRQGWEAIADGHLADATSAIDRLRRDPTVAADGPRVEALRTAYAVALWQKGQWRTLFLELCPSVGRSQGTRSLRRAIRRLPEVRGSPLVAALNDRGARAGADRGALCDVIADAVEAGASAAAGLAALGRVAADSEPDAHDPDLRAALRAGALCGIAGADAACADVATPFHAVLPGAFVATPRMSRTTSGAWQATEPGHQRPLWDAPPPPREQGSAINLPLSDGSVLLGEGPYLIRREGRSGRLLSRIPLPGLALQAWPLPPDRTRIGVALWAGRARGSVVRITMDPDWPEAPAWTADGAEAWVGARPALLALADESLDEAARRIGLRQSHARLDWRAWQIAVLEIHRAVARDLADFEMGLAALETADADTRTATRGLIAPVVVAQSSALSPLAATVVARRLDAVGAEVEADQVLERAANASLRGGANVDLDLIERGASSAFVREAAANAWLDGRHERALALLQRSLRFGATRPGDRLVAAKARAWHAQRGQPLPADLAALADRADDPHARLRSALDFGRMDMALIVLTLLAPMLLGALLRLWWRSSPSRLADLHAAGFRDRRARIFAFFAYPRDRLRLIFLAYSSRSERLALGVFGVGLLALVTTLTFELARAERVGHVPAALARADVGHPDRAALLRELLVADAAGRAARQRLLAETAVATGHLADARAALERALADAADDVASRVNLAVLDELAGDRAAAHAGYAAIDHPVARWNLARLDGLPRGVDTPALQRLAWRDRVVAEGEPDAPLWARPATADLRAVYRGRAIDGVLMVLHGLIGRVDPMREMMRDTLDASSDFAVFGLLFDSALAAVLGCLALLALPMPVRTFVPRRASARGRQVGRLVAWIAPGWRLAGEGQAALGIGICVAVSLGAAATISSLGLGPLAARIAEQDTGGLLAGVEASVVSVTPWPMKASAALGALALLLHLALELRAHRERSAERAGAVPAVSAAPAA